MDLTVEIDREGDGRWLAEVAELQGVMAYGKDEADAFRRAVSLALRVLADRVEHGELALSDDSKGLRMSIAHSP
jgi:predicted RNase H-like HicB family nuclease